MRWCGTSEIKTSEQRQNCAQPVLPMAAFSSNADHSRGMEPTVRSPRIEPAIRSGRCSNLASQQTQFPRRLVSSVPKFSRRERNFWMQRPEAKNPPERPLLSAETGNVENGRQASPRKGAFSIDDGCRSSGRLGGRRDRDRTCDPLDVKKARSRSQPFETSKNHE